MLCVCDAIQQQQRLFSTSDTPTKPQRCRHRPCNKLKQSVTKWLQHWLTASVPVSVPWRSLSAQRHDRKKKKKKKKRRRGRPRPHPLMPSCPAYVTQQCKTTRHALRDVHELRFPGGSSAAPGRQKKTKEQQRGRVASRCRGVARAKGLWGDRPRTGERRGC